MTERQVNTFGSKKCLNANNFQLISYFTNIAFQNKANYATLLAEAEQMSKKSCC